MKKHLFLNLVCNWCPHFETELELMLDFMKKGDNVYSLSCDKLFNEFCISNQNHGPEYCNQCCIAYKNGLKLIKFPPKNMLKFSDVECPDFPLFKDQKELSEYSVDGINIGFGVSASFMSVSRDYLFDTVKHKEQLEGYLKTAYIVAKNMEIILKELKPDSVYLFNGRFLQYWPAAEVCRKYNIDFYLHERGPDPSKYQLIKNDMFHRPQRYYDEIDFYWNNAKEPEKSEIGKKWFVDRRNGVEQDWVVFTKDQQKGSLPIGFDASKNNISIFNSSMDEYYAFSEWQNPIADNENEIIKAILDHYKNDESKHFYLRLHPNLKNVVTTQIIELKEIEKLNYKNLTIIWAEEPLDTYSLIEASDKVISFSSTVGIEAAFWNKPSILAGISMYRHLDCCYLANSYEELFNLIESNLTPKDPKATYPYGYWLSAFGTKFTHFKPEGLFNGTFLGKRIRPVLNKKKTLLQKIVREIQYPFKKVFNKTFK